MVKAEIEENQSQKIPKKRKEKERVMAKKTEVKPPVIDEEDVERELDKALDNYELEGRNLRVNEAQERRGGGGGGGGGGRW